VEEQPHWTELPDDQKNEIDKWLSFYLNHKEYPFVGRLVPDPQKVGNAGQSHTSRDL